MVSFESDYIAGAHPEILKRLMETNLEPMPGYGNDVYCESAKEKIKKAIGREDVEIEFLAGGTQTNAVIISTMLADYEGVVAAATGHISAHDGGFHQLNSSGKRSISVIGQLYNNKAALWRNSVCSGGNPGHMGAVTT